MAGQINRGSFLGETVYRLSSKREFKTFVEVGTWNGEGSTKCFMDALLYRCDDSILYTVEANIEFYEQAKKYWQPLLTLSRTPHIKMEMLYGRLIDPTELISIEEIRAHKIFNQHPWLEWRERNVGEYKACDDVLDLSLIHI